MNEKTTALLPKQTTTPTPGETTKGQPKIDKKKSKRDKEDAYDKFLRKYKKQWCWFNVICTVGSILLAVGTFNILWFYESSCGSLKAGLWAVFTMHIVNTIETLLNFTGLEKKLCSGTLMCAFFIFEVTVLIYMQVVYFEALQMDCIQYTPLLYFWLMSQILVFYGVVVLTVCFFFRKFCQDPDLVDGEDDE